MKALSIVILILLSGAKLQAQDKYSPIYRMLMEGQAQEAVVKTAELLSSSSGDMELYYLQAYAYKQLYRYPEAIKSLTEALTLAPNNRRALEMLADCYSLQGLYRKASETAQRLYECDTTNVTNSYRLAISWQAENRLAKATEMLEKLSRGDTSNVQYLKSLGDCYLKSNRMADAAVCYEKARSYNPQNLNLLLFLSNIYYTQKQYPLAVERAQTGLAIDSTSCELLKIVGISAFLLGDIPKSFNAFSRAYELGDSSSVVTKYIGIGYYNLDNFKSAIFHLQRSYTSDSTNVETIYFLSAALSQTEKKQEAKTFIDKAFKRLEPDPEFLSLLYEQNGFVCRSIAKPEEAYSSYEKAYKLNPKKKNLLFNMASVLRKMERYQASLDMYRRFLAESNEPEEKPNAEVGRLSYANIARNQIKQLKEQLFFMGTLDK